MTNEEKIRSKSRKELARFIFEVLVYSAKSKYEPRRFCGKKIEDCKHDCPTCISEWLEQEAEKCDQ